MWRKEYRGKFPGFCHEALVSQIPMLYTGRKAYTERRMMIKFDI